MDVCELGACVDARVSVVHLLGRRRSDHVGDVRRARVRVHAPSAHEYARAHVLLRGAARDRLA